MRCVVALFVLGLAPSGALAEGLPILGTYGDEAGCATSAGHAPAGDSLLIVQADEITGYESVCEVAESFPLKDGGFVVLAACAAEGLREVRHFTVLPDAEYTSLGVHAEDGRFLGTVRPCTQESAQ